MKTTADEIKNKDVKSMDKAQLDEFKKEFDTFTEKTKFIRNARLLKILYYVFGYALGICVGLCIGKVLMTYIYSGVFSVKYFVIACVLLVVCIAFEVLYRVAKHKGNNYNTIINDKLIDIKAQYSFFEMKERDEKEKAEQTTAQPTVAPEKQTDNTDEQPQNK